LVKVENLEEKKKKRKELFVSRTETKEADNIMLNIRRKVEREKEGEEIYMLHEGERGGKEKRQRLLTRLLRRKGGGSLLLRRKEGGARENILPGRRNKLKEG